MSRLPIVLSYRYQLGEQRIDSHLINICQVEEVHLFLCSRTEPLKIN
jgi:hypothetical protein